MKTLQEICEWVAVEKVYRPILATEVNQSDLMDELENQWDSEKFPSLFAGKNINLDSAFSETFDEWMTFNDWIKEENITGYFAEVRIPVREYRSETSASFSFSYCHCNFIYYESDEELLNKLISIKEYWNKYDKEEFIKKLNADEKEVKNE